MTVEAVLVQLGAVVAKAAIRLWLGNDPLAVDLESDAIDMLAGRLDRDLDQRKLRRIAEHISDDVAERLWPMLGAGFGALPENERLAALEAAQEKLRVANLTNAALFAVDLDARRVYNTVRAGSKGSETLLSSKSRELYELILRECCGYIIEISRGLPPFGADALTEILRRETQIVADIRDVLSRLPQRTTTEFSYDYRQLVARVMDRVEIFGAAVSDSNRRYPLSVAYLNLTATAGTLGSFSAASAGWRIDNLLAGSNRVLIRGEAGLGKTTLLQWVAVRAAKRDFQPPLTHWNDIIPFFIPLRRYADRPFPTPEMFLDEVGANIANTMPKGWVQSELRSGHAVVLIDGIDEVASERRGEARDWLESLTADFPLARYLVTSRPAAITGRWLQMRDFLVADLRPMSRSDIKHFVERWHDAVGQDIAADGEARKELMSYCEDLLLAIERRDHLRKLAGFPLLCALLCAINRDRRAALPGSRMELYEIALDMMLDRRDAERRIHGPAGLGKAEKLILLGDIAFWLLRNGYVDAERDRVEQQVDRVLLTMPQVESPGNDVYRFLLDRSGLLREQVEGRVDFVHRSFQEYLAARAAVIDDDLGTLASNATKDAWHDVIVMASGHAQRSQRAILLTSLLDAAAVNPRDAARLNLLAVACLETSPELDPALRQRIEGRVATLVPPKSVVTAPAFASAGPFVLGLLATADLRTVQEAAATIRAIAMIGGPQALAALTKFGRDDRQTVQQELVSAWNEFDTDSYAREILADLPLPTLTVRDTDTALATRHLRHLRNLTAPVPRSGDLSFVPPTVTELTLSAHACDVSTLNSPYLTKLSIQCAPAANYSLDVSELRNFQELTYVDLTANNLHGLEALKVLTKLRGVRLARGLSLDELRWIPENVTALSLSDISRAGVADDLGSLPQAVALDELTFLKCAGHATLAGATNNLQSTLKTLRVLDCGVFTQFRGLEKFVRLQALDFTDTIVPDISPIARAPSLEILTIGSARAARDLIPLRASRSLREIRITSGGKVDLRGLAGMRGLTVRIEGSTVYVGADSLGAGSTVSRASVVQGVWEDLRRA